MDNSQYHPPHTEHSAELYKQAEQSVINASPERIRSPFQFTKDIETLVDSIRNTEEAIEQKNGRVIGGKYVPITFVRPARSHADIFKAQLDKERSLTTDLFAEKNKYSFWYGGTAHAPQATPDIASWFIEELSTGRITRIQTHPDCIQMFNHDGKLVPMVLSDLEIFVPLIQHYVKTILPAYPFDYNRAEVILDGIDIPENIEMLLPPQSNNIQKTDYTQAA